MRSFIFKPSIALMSRLSYFKKFTLIILLFLIPLIVLISATYLNVRNEMINTENEIAGLKYTKGIRELIQHVQQHRGLSAVYLAGDSKTRDNLKKKQAELHSDINNIDELDKKYGKELQTTKEWKQLKDEWFVLAEDVYDIPLQEAIDRHTELLSKLLTFTAEIADKSNLVLDPEIGNFYMVQAITEKLPWVTEYMGRSRAIGSGVLGKKSMTNEEEYNLLFLTQVMQKATEDTQRGMEIVYQENKEVRTELEQLNNEVLGAVMNIVQVVNKEILETDQYSMANDVYYNLTTETINEVYSLLDRQTNLLSEQLQERIISLSLYQTILASVVCIILFIIIYLFTGLYLSINDTILKINDVAEAIALGDLTKRVELQTKDETKKIEESFNSIVNSFREMVQLNQKLGEDLATSSQQLSTITTKSSEETSAVVQAIQEVAAGGQSQMLSAEETTRALEEMSIGIQRVAENASIVTEVAQKTAEEAEEGTEFIQSAIVQINLINDSVQHTAPIIEKLGERSKEIGTILEAITEITSQTNLLALNAAIEAARAGEHGRGFAIVAEEVRKLADQSKASADQISSIISEIQGSSGESVKAMSNVITEVQTGTKVIAGVNEIFQKIILASQEVAVQIEEVSATSEEMSASSEEITATVIEMSRIASDSATKSQTVSTSSLEQLAIMKEITTSAQQLKEKSIDLQKVIKKFKV